MFGGGPFERAYFQIFFPGLLQGAEPRLSRTNDELELVDVVGAREASSLRVPGNDLQSVHGEVEVLSLQTFEQVVEVVTLELDFAAEFLGQSVFEVHLKADKFAFAILEDVGNAAVGIGGPQQRPGLVLIAGSLGRDTACQNHQK